VTQKEYENVQPPAHQNIYYIHTVTDVGDWEALFAVQW